MDMALRDVVVRLPTKAPRPASGCVSRQALEAIGDATQAAMMMALVWPAILSMPFFWAPPLWVLAGMSARAEK